MTDSSSRRPRKKRAPADAGAATGGGEDDLVTTQLHRLYDKIAAEPLPVRLLVLLDVLTAKP